MIEMIESGKYTEGILLTMAMLAVAQEIHLWSERRFLRSSAAPHAAYAISEGRPIEFVWREGGTPS